MTVIQTTNLRKTYEVRTPGDNASFLSKFKRSTRTITAVQDINLTVEAGESVAFLGPNGAGKSTTIKLLSGILHPDSGDARVMGLVPWKDRKQLAYQVGSVFGQKSQLWYHLPPRDSMELLGAIYEIEPPLLHRRIAALVERFGLQDLMDVPVRKLSLGQRVRCEVAASLLHEPKILFLDEPTIGLDVVVKEEIRKLLLDWNRDKKVTIFLTSHDLGDVEKICRRAVLIHHGTVVLDESLEELKKKAGRFKVLEVRYREAPAGGMATVLSSVGLRFAQYAQVFQASIGVNGVPGGPAAQASNAAPALQAAVASSQSRRLSPEELEATHPIQVLGITGQTLRFMVDTRRASVQDLLQGLIARGEVEDFTVEDEELEKLVGDLYRSHSKEEAHARASQ